jgi:hypothetical protein
MAAGFCGAVPSDRRVSADGLGAGVGLGAMAGADWNRLASSDDTEPEPALVVELGRDFCAEISDGEGDGDGDG